LLALALALLAVGLLAGCGGGGVSSDAVVRVNGQAISKATFSHWMGIAASASTAAPRGKKAPKPATPDPKVLQQQVLGFLISADWVIGQAEEQGVKVSDTEVQTQFNKLEKKQFPKEAEFQKFLAITSQTASDLLLRMKISMLSSKIQEKVAKPPKQPVSEAAVARYYNEHSSLHSLPEKRDLQIILTKTEAAAQQARTEIQSGKSFASVAKRRSIDPVSRSSGGATPGVVKGQQQKALSEAVFAAQKGVLTGPVKTPFGYYVFEVKAVHAPTRQTLAQVKESVKQQLAASQQQSTLSKFVKEFRERWKARTECSTGYVVADCKQYKEPKTTTTPAATATP